MGVYSKQVKELSLGYYRRDRLRGADKRKERYNRDERD